MNSFQGTSLQNCNIEINNMDFHIKNESDCVDCHQTKNHGVIGIKIEVLPSTIVPRITLNVSGKTAVQLDINLILKNNANLEFLDESSYNFDTDIKIKSVMEKDSCFELYRLNKLNNLSRNSFSHSCTLGESCVFKDFNFTNGSKDANNETIVTLSDKNSKYVNYEVVITNSTNCKNTLKVNHNSCSATSDCSFKSVSRGNAKVTFNGKIFVDKDCSQTVSKQISKGLIMNEESKVSLVPKLEIHNDDVVCSHGAASGRPDESVLFYLTSRGINRVEAEKIYIQGFLGEFIEKIDNVQMQAKAKQYITLNS